MELLSEHCLVDGEGQGDVDDATTPASSVLSPLSRFAWNIMVIMASRVIGGQERGEDPTNLSDISVPVRKILSYWSTLNYL